MSREEYLNKRFIDERLERIKDILNEKNKGMAMVKLRGLLNLSIRYGELKQKYISTLEKENHNETTN